MQPTPRAVALAPLINRALADVAAALRRSEPFVPATAKRTFLLGAGDYAELVLLPKLAARLASSAPGIDLFIRAVPDDIPAAIALGDLDAVIAPARPRDVAGPGIFQRLLFEEQFVCAVRAGHPATTRRLTLDRYCSLDHLLIAPRGTYGGLVDDALATLRKRRRVALAVPHFLIVPHVVASTDLVVTLASRVAAAFTNTHDLVMLRPPTELALDGFPMHLLWHERAHADDAQRWFRDQIAVVAGGA
jgi:DNA-binding transcriptional LysR family regulator